MMIAEGRLEIIPSRLPCVLVPGIAHSWEFSLLMPVQHPIQTHLPLRVACPYTGSSKVSHSALNKQRI